MTTQGPTVKAHEIKLALAERHKDDLFLTEVKNGPTYSATKGELLIIDALAIKKSWANPRIDGYEIKISRSDFVRDNKFQGYMQMCNAFWFVTVKGIATEAEIPDEAGWIEYNPKRKTLYTRKKAPYREIEIPVKMFYYIMMTRLDSDRYPFFSSREEYIKAYLEHKIETRELAFRLKSRLIEQVAALEKQNKELRNKLETYELMKNDYQEAAKVLGIWDVINYFWSKTPLTDKIIELKKYGYNGKHLSNAIEQIKNALTELGKIQQN